MPTSRKTTKAALAAAAAMPTTAKMGFWLTCNHVVTFSIGSSDKPAEEVEVRVA